MLNCYYDLIGFNQKIAVYEDQWADAVERAERWHSKRDESLVHGASAGHLSWTFNAFGQRDSAAIARAHDEATGWVKQFVSFAGWILAAWSDRLPATTARVFLSPPRGQVSAEQMLNGISKHLNGYQSATARRTRAVTGAPANGEPIENAVQRRIAFGHSLLAVIPSGGEDLLDSLIREVEYADLRGKPVSIIVELGADRQRIKQAFETFNDYMASAEERIPQDQRRERMSAMVSEFVYTAFRDGAALYISPDLAKELDRVAVQMRDQLLFDLVLGQLNFFQPQDIRVHSYAMKHLKRPQRKKKLSEGIAKAMGESKIGLVRERFEGAWRKVKKRAIIIDGSGFPLLTVPKGGSYQSNLQSIIRKLRPELSPSERDKLEARIIAAIPGGPGES
jgi:hypothetical protein